MEWEDRMTLADRIRLARRQAGLSQRELAATLGVLRSAVSNWESPTGNRPAMANLIQLAQIFRVSIEWLATGRGAMHLPAETPALTASGNVISDIEQRLVSAYRRAPAHLKRLILYTVEAHPALGEERSR